VEVPLFPLRSVHYPGLPVPLHVFEPRYRALVTRCLEEDSTFGTILIVRGPEVGPGAETAGVGTEVRIVTHQVLHDGRYLVAGLGERRFRIMERLPDAPYPRAEVEFLREGPVSAEPDKAATQLNAGIRSYLTLLGIDSSQLAELEVSTDTWLAVYQVSALLRIDWPEKQTLLEAPSVDERLRLVLRLLTREIALFEHLRRGGEPGRG